MAPRWHGFLLLLFYLSRYTAAETELSLIARWDFEESPTSESPWKILKSALALDTLCQSGFYAARISQREVQWATVELQADVSENTRYFFSAYIKFLTMPDDSMFETVNLKARFSSPNGTIASAIIGLLRFHGCTSRFTPVSGDFLTPPGTITVRFRLEMDAEIDYLFDEAELSEVIPEVDWRAAADDRIATYRMSNITINLTLQPELNPDHYTVEVQQTSQAFPFGSAVRARLLEAGDSASHNYRQFFLDNFNWAVLENSLKWLQMEKERGVLTSAMAERTIDMLEANGIPYRGHAVFWDIQDKNPDWVEVLEGAELREALWSRLEGVMGQLADRPNLKHWDLNNEHLVGRFYEQATGDPNLMEEMFVRARAADPDVQLFMNEYRLMNQGGLSVQAYLNAASALQRAGAPLGGLGIQSHLKDGIDITLMKRRLDALAELGLPLWITELTVNEANVTSRAQGYEDALRLYFSHPAIEGVLVWGFWDGAHYDMDATLAEGPNITLNAAGEKYFALRKHWTTHAKLWLGGQTTVHRLLGYHGDYNVTIRRQGQIVAATNFTLHKDAAVQVDITV